MTEDLSRCFVVDLETTGVDTKTAIPCEYAIYSFATNEMKAQLVNPEIPIPVETSAVHHITDEDVEYAPKWSELRVAIKDALSVPPGQLLPILVAHNAAYENGILAPYLPPVLWICTYKVALRVFPDAPNHKNETLRYFLKLGERGRQAPAATHSAGHDTWVTAQILVELLKHATIEQMIQWTELPAKFKRMPFGKHAGQEWNTIPYPYLQWCANNLKDNPDIIYNIKEEMARRR